MKRLLPFPELRCRCPVNFGRRQSFHFQIWCLRESLQQNHLTGSAPAKVPIQSKDSKHKSTINLFFKTRDMAIF